MPEGIVAHRPERAGEIHAHQNARGAYHAERGNGNGSVAPTLEAAMFPKAASCSKFPRSSTPGTGRYNLSFLARYSQNTVNDLNALDAPCGPRSKRRHPGESIFPRYEKTPRLCPSAFGRSPALAPRRAHERAGPGRGTYDEGGAARPRAEGRDHRLFKPSASRGRAPVHTRFLGRAERGAEHSA